MKRVILEPPYSGDIEANTEYARMCMLDCLKRDEAPFASHLLYTQCLNDLKPEEREWGIKAGFEWGKVAEKVVVYTDRGISGGMKLGIENAEKNDLPVEYRTLNHTP